MSVTSTDSADSYPQFFSYSPQESRSKSRWTSGGVLALPEDLILEAFKFLRPTDELPAVATVCRVFRACQKARFNTDFLWFNRQDLSSLVFRTMLSKYQQLRAIQYTGEPFILLSHHSSAIEEKIQKVHLQKVYLRGLTVSECFIKSMNKQRLTDVQMPHVQTGTAMCKPETYEDFTQLQSFSAGSGGNTTAECIRKLPCKLLELDLTQVHQGTGWDSEECEAVYTELLGAVSEHFTSLEMLILPKECIFPEEFFKDLKVQRIVWG